MPQKWEDGIKLFLRRMAHRCLELLPDWFIKMFETVERQKMRLQFRLSRHYQPEDRRDRYYRHAIAFIRHSQAHRNILTICALRRRERRRTLEAYMVQSSSAYQALLQVVVITHCFLIVLEPTMSQMQNLFVPNVQKYQIINNFSITSRYPLQRAFVAMSFLNKNG